MKKLTVKEVKVKLPNGFTFLIDFADDLDLSDVCNSWNQYYTSKGIKGFEIYTENCKSLENFSEYNNWSIRLFGEIFVDLSCHEKLSVVEMADELAA